MNAGECETWKEGRRIIELDVLSQVLAGCVKCGIPLQLSHSTGINTFGLSAMIKVCETMTICNRG